MPRSHVDLTATNNDQPTTTDHLKVMNWNLEFFGARKYGPSNDSLQLNNVATVLNYTQPDIVALQEVSSDEAFRHLLDRTPGYDGRCSNRYSYSFDPSGDFPPQKLCFIYRSSTVKVVREKILFRKLFDDEPSEMFSSGRLPYLLDVDVMGRRLHLVNLHAKSGAQEADLGRRRSDAQLLKDSIDRFYRDTDLVLLGDLNDDVDKSIVPDHESPYTMFRVDYKCVSELLSNQGWHSTISYDDMIDHQIISSSMSDFHVSTKIVNAFVLVPLYGKTTSDHLPVMSEFDLSKLVTGINRERPVVVFPNPTHDKLWFPRGSDITVINSFGEIVIKKQGAYPPISLGEYAPGLYSVVLGDQLVRIIRN
jgi:endonuclease/exonuclease/phosphatase family metal-dependent hydrolase